MERMKLRLVPPVFVGRTILPAGVTGGAGAVRGGDATSSSLGIALGDAPVTVADSARGGGASLLDGTGGNARSTAIGRANGASTVAVEATARAGSRPGSGKSWNAAANGADHPRGFNWVNSLYLGIWIQEDCLGIAPTLDIEDSVV